MELFNLKNHFKITLLSDADIEKNLDILLPEEMIFEQQGDRHEDLDLSLVDKIDKYVVPILGDYERTDRWFHNVSLCNGDGVRGMSFDFQDLNNELIIGLQKTLNVPHSDFCIFCNIFKNHASDDAVRIGSVIIKCGEVIVSNEVISYDNQP